jgi:hypothetical protein
MTFMPITHPSRRCQESSQLVALRDNKPERFGAIERFALQTIS